MVNAYMKRVADKINVLEDTIEMLSDDQLKAKTTEFRSKIQVNPIRVHLPSRTRFACVPPPQCSGGKGWVKVGSICVLLSL